MARPDRPLEGLRLYPPSHGLSYAVSLVWGSQTRVNVQWSRAVWMKRGPSPSSPSCAPALHFCNDKSRVAATGGQTRVDGEEGMATPRARGTRRQMLLAGAGAVFVPFALKAGRAPAQGRRKVVE